MSLSAKLTYFVSASALLLGAARLVAGCGDSSLDAGEPDASSDPSPDAGQRLDAAAPGADASSQRDASASNDASPTDASTPDEDAGVDAGQIEASLATDFSATSNPTGAWSYGYSLAAPASDASALIVYPSELSESGVDCWYDADNVALGAPAVCYNGSDVATATGVAPGEAALHPGQNGEYSIARWTAAAAGSYAVHVQFKAGDQGETTGFLVHNGTVLWSVDATSSDPTDERTVTMAAGDTLDVAVGSDDTFLYDTTPVIFTIHSIP